MFMKPLTRRVTVHVTENDVREAQRTNVPGAFSCPIAIAASRALGVEPGPNTGVAMAVHIYLYDEGEAVHEGAQNNGRLNIARYEVAKRVVKAMNTFDQTRNMKPFSFQIRPEMLIGLYNAQANRL